MDSKKNILWDGSFQKVHKRSLIYALSKVSLFSGVSKEDLSKLAKFCHIRSYKDREIIFGQDDPAYGMFIVLEGQVDIYSIENRRANEIASYKNYSYFGEVSFSRTGKRGVSAVSNGECILCYIFKDDLKKLFSKNYDFGVKYYENLVLNLTDRLEYASKLLKYERTKHK
jgi:signal-transduction protein with cAMP-binding, CBS, and nucleotidyltransferase domain